MNIFDRMNLQSVKKTILGLAYSTNFAGQPINPKAGAYSAEPNRRGLETYTIAQILEGSGRTKDGSIATYGIEQPYFYLTPNQRIETYKLC